MIREWWRKRKLRSELDRVTTLIALHGMVQGVTTQMWAIEMNRLVTRMAEIKRELRLLEGHDDESTEFDQLR